MPVAAETRQARRSPSHPPPPKIPAIALQKKWKRETQEVKPGAEVGWLGQECERKEEGASKTETEKQCGNQGEERRRK